MAFQPKEKLMSLLGLIAWGDIGELTMYKSRQNRVIIFTKTWPKKPPSPGQVAQRAKMTAGAVAWQALTPATRAQWELASKRCSLCMNGYHAFQHFHMTPDATALATLERQTRTDLTP